MEKENERSEGKDIFTMFIRFIGIFILIFGIWIGYQTVLEGWKLYKTPQTIENFSQKVEEGSRLNQFAESLCKLTQEMMAKTIEKMPQAPGQKVESSKLPPLTPFRFSYFAAWGIAIFLLLIIAKIACWIIATGAKIAVYSNNTEKIAMAMVKQIMLEMSTKR